MISMLFTNVKEREGLLKSQIAKDMSSPLRLIIVINIKFLTSAQ